MTDTATPRNEAAERLLLIDHLILGGWSVEKAEQRLDSALAHERQQGREEAVREGLQQIEAAASRVGLVGLSQVRNILWSIEPDAIASLRAE